MSFRKALVAALVAFPLFLSTESVAGTCEELEQEQENQETMDFWIDSLQGDGFQIQLENDSSALLILDTGNGFYQALVRNDGQAPQIQFIPK